METARGIPPGIFIPFECAYEDHSNGFIILIPAGFLGGRVRTPIPVRFHEFNRNRGIFPPTEISPRPPPPSEQTLLFRHSRILRSSLINREFNFQPMILSRRKKKEKETGIVLRGHGYIIWRYIIRAGGVNRAEEERKGGVKTLLATRMGARNPHERALSLPY